MGLFKENGIRTVAAQIEAKAGVLYLVEAQPRGAPANRNRDADRRLIPLNTVHLPVEDRLQADEVQDVREFASENALQSVQSQVNEKLGTIRQSLEATFEFHRVGAVKGVVYDADGTKVLYNLYDVFGVQAPDVINFKLSATDPEPGALRTLIHGVQRQIEDELGATPLTGTHALVGATFMDKLVSHPETLKAYERWRDGQALRESYARRTFEYAGTLFEEYRGKVGQIDFIAANEARFFPVGVPELFRRVNAPANFIETVNTVGLPIYAKQVIDPAGRWVDIFAQANPLHYCTRPRVLVRGIADSL
jgi:hypothetical protein